jgi:anti-sigma regulatory factor (Ser/Thr protein kinase)
MFGAWLERTGASPDERFEILLAVHEACANAIEHPQRPRRQVFEVSASQSGQTISIAVRDHGLWRAAGSRRLRGRGLELIGELTHQVDIERGDLGTTVLMFRRIADRQKQRPSQRGGGQKQEPSERGGGSHREGRLRPVSAG